MVGIIVRTRDDVAYHDLCATQVQRREAAVRIQVTWLRRPVATDSLMLPCSIASAVLTPLHKFFPAELLALPDAAVSESVPRARSACAC